MQTNDPYLAIANLGLLQRQAGVDRQTAELVTTYARLLVDAGEPLLFDKRPFAVGSVEATQFAELKQKNPETDERFLAFLASYCARMIERGHTPLVTRDDLARRLGCELNDVVATAARNASLYREIRLPRSNGTFRTIHSPREPLKGFQRWILDHVLRAYQPHSAAHGFVRGRSIVSHAAHHTGHNNLLVMDIADFFPAITVKRVRKGFEKLGYPYSVALLLANLCTRSGQLPQGASTSPALSNLVCHRLDRRLAGFAASRGLTYSRYADDMTFSSSDRRIGSFVPFIRQVIEEEGFAVRDGKTRISRAGARRVVTGIVVNERLNLPRAHVRMLRAAAHQLATKGPDGVMVASNRGGAKNPERVLRGHLAFLAMINPQRGEALVRHAAAERRERGNDQIV